MAGGNKTKKVRIEEDRVDRITDLPVLVREHILDCMRIKDAVATSVLSRKWRYCWTGLRKLKFDEDFWDIGNDRTLLNQLEHARAIDRLLMLHSGPILEFILCVPYTYDKKLDLNMWFRVLSNKGVKKIEINACYITGPIPMPSCLLHFRELEHLTLRNCQLPDRRDFKGFANLTSLSIDNVFTAPGILERLISRCPLLDTLSIDDTELVMPVAIEAPNLKSFYFDGIDPGVIIFKDVPKLTAVSFFYTNTIAKLNLPLGGNCPRCARTPLQNLKSLTMRSVNLRLVDDVLFALCLMNSAPILQHLTIHLSSNEESEISKEEAAKLLKSEAKKHLSYNNLHKIKVCGMDGLGHERLLIKLLQTRCRNAKVYEFYHRDKTLGYICGCCNANV